MAQLIEWAAKSERLTTTGIVKLKLLIDENATRARILDEINSLVAEAKPSDLVVFYFSGHVAREPTTKRLLAYDFADQPQLSATEIVGSFGKCAATCVVIVDG